MKYKAIKLSMTIKLISAFVILLTVALMVMSIFKPTLIFAGSILCVSIVLCYLWAPVEYEISNNTLKVYYRWGGKEFQMVKRCSAITEKPGMEIRLFGNGGLFAGTGIFWNKQYGVFRAYVTTARFEDMVMIETDHHQKIIISPENRERFIEESKAEIT